MQALVACVSLDFWETGGGGRSTDRLTDSHPGLSAGRPPRRSNSPLLPCEFASPRKIQAQGGVFAALRFFLSLCWAVWITCGHRSGDPRFPPHLGVTRSARRSPRSPAAFSSRPETKFC